MCFPVAQMVKHLPVMQETRVRFLGREDPLEKGMTTHPSVLALRIPWTEEPDRAIVHGVAKSWTWLIPVLLFCATDNISLGWTQGSHPCLHGLWSSGRKKITTNHTYSIEKLIKIQWQCILNASCQVLIVPLEQWWNQDSVHTVLRNAWNCFFSFCFL